MGIGISKITIYEEDNKVLADIDRFTKCGKSETIVWNNTNERNNILRFIDGYTLIEDTRMSKLMEEK